MTRHDEARRLVTYGLVAAIAALAAPIAPGAFALLVSIKDRSGWSPPAPVTKLRDREDGRVKHSHAFTRPAELKFQDRFGDQPHERVGR